MESNFNSHFYANINIIIIRIEAIPLLHRFSIPFIFLIKIDNLIGPPGLLIPPLLETYKREWGYFLHSC